MVGLVTLEAMAELARLKYKSPIPLNNVILAAPDIDYDLFVTQIEDLKPVRDRIFVLVSDDSALALSKRIAGGVGRVGALDPAKIAELGVNVVDLQQIHDLENQSHRSFSHSPQIVQLIGLGIKTLSTSQPQCFDCKIHTFDAQDSDQFGVEKYSKIKGPRTSPRAVYFYIKLKA